MKGGFTFQWGDFVFQIWGGASVMMRGSGQKNCRIGRAVPPMPLPLQWETL